jgi:predicted nucleotidyltransferase
MDIDTSHNKRGHSDILRNRRLQIRSNIIIFFINFNYCQLKNSTPPILAKALIQPKGPKQQYPLSLVLK